MTQDLFCICPVRAPRIHVKIMIRTKEETWPFAAGLIFKDFYIFLFGVIMHSGECFLTVKPGEGAKHHVILYQK